MKMKSLVTLSAVALMSCPKAPEVKNLGDLSLPRLSITEFEEINEADRIRANRVYDGVCEKFRSVLEATNSALEIKSSAPYVENLKFGRLGGGLVIQEGGITYVDKDLDGSLEKVIGDVQSCSAKIINTRQKTTGEWKPVVCEKYIMRHRGNLFHLNERLTSDCSGKDLQAGKIRD